MKYTKEYQQRMRVAKKIVLSTKNPSISYLQRKMEIGYNYAAILMEDISKQRGFRFVYRYRRKLLNHTTKTKPYSGRYIRHERERCKFRISHT